MNKPSKLSASAIIPASAAFAAIANAVRAFSVGPALTDLGRALRLWRVIAYMAAGDLRARYRRSVLGPFWMTLGTAAGTLGLGLVWSALLRMDRAVFVPPLTAGLIIWQLLSACIVEATTTYGRQRAILLNLPLPLSLPPIQMVVKHLINFAHNLPVFLVVMLLFQLPPTRYHWLLAPCLLLLAANLLWLTLLLAMLGARFRDLEYVVAASMPLLMFLSPVFYRPHYLPFDQFWLWLNPFSHLIELLRYPLLGAAPPAFVVGVNAAMCALGWLLVLWLFNSKRDRIAYWL
jgi:ABC-type polysaccharide/polyol phosphate export permease